MNAIVIATRKSPLALAQSQMVAARLRTALGFDTSLLKIVTTGDRQSEWVLSKQGGKGLFTGELEEALLRGEAQCAVHSAKDLPGAMAPGLVVAGYLPRADPRDVLVLRDGVSLPKILATGSPRRQQQLARLFPDCRFTEIRGNVDTRLRKIAEGAADGTVLAAAGLARLGIASWTGVSFRPLAVTEMVPAVGQAAIAVQSRAADAVRFVGVFDSETARQLAIERALQEALGGGCHTAFGAHVAGTEVHLYHEKSGMTRGSLSAGDFAAPGECAARIVKQFGWK